MFGTGKWTAAVATGCLAVVGAVLWRCFGLSHWTSPTLWLATGLLAAGSATCVILGRRLDRMSQLAFKDALTGLYNRRYVSRTLPHKLQQARLEGRRLSVSMLDVNDFKQINDSFGHHVGDVLLQHIAYALDSSLKKGELAARWGGDEFIVIGPFHDAENGELQRLVNERLRQLSDKYQLELSVSVGTAVYPDDAASLEELMHLADGKMFHAKCERKDIGRADFDVKIG